MRRAQQDLPNLQLAYGEPAGDRRLREALDPDQLGGSQIALPNDKKLISDLTSPEYRIGPQGIELEAKDKLTKRLGRSTDRGDAVVMAWWAGARMASNWR